MKTTELISEAAGCVLAEVYQIQRDQDDVEEAWEALQFAWEKLDANLVDFFRQHNRSALSGTPTRTHLDQHKNELRSMLKELLQEERNTGQFSD